MPTYEMESLLGHLSVEHRELHARLQHLRRLFVENEPSPTIPAPERLTEISRELGLLDEELREHFAREEAGGFLEEAVTRRPALNHEGERLIREHSELLDELAALRNTACKAVRDPAAWPTALAEFNALCRKLCEHERSENQLIQRGYNVDFNDLLE